MVSEKKLGSATSRIEGSDGECLRAHPRVAPASADPSCMNLMQHSYGDACMHACTHAFGQREVVGGDAFIARWLLLLLLSLSSSYSSLSLSWLLLFLFQRLASGQLPSSFASDPSGSLRG